MGYYHGGSRTVGKGNHIYLRPQRVPVSTSITQYLAFVGSLVDEEVEFSDVESHFTSESGTMCCSVSECHSFFIWKPIVMMILGLGLRRLI